jgi:hypothetical protein
MEDLSSSNEGLWRNRCTSGGFVRAGDKWWLHKVATLSAGQEATKARKRRYDLDVRLYGIQKGRWFALKPEHITTAPQTTASSAHEWIPVSRQQQMEVEEWWYNSDDNLRVAGYGLGGSSVSAYCSEGRLEIIGQAIGSFRIRALTWCPFSVEKTLISLAHHSGAIKRVCCKVVMIPVLNNSRISVSRERKGSKSVLEMTESRLNF